MIITERHKHLTVATSLNNQVFAVLMNVLSFLTIINVKKSQFHKIVADFARLLFGAGLFIVYC